MKNWIAAILLAMAAGAGLRAQSRDTERPVESEHHHGPHRLEAWTLNWAVPEIGNGERYPGTLVIAQNGKIVRKIKGDPFMWKWIFLEDGRKVAYESGPMHWRIECYLAEVRTGRVIGSFDCVDGSPKTAPAWAKALEEAP